MMMNNLDMYNTAVLLCFSSNSDFAILQRDISSNAQNNDSIPKDECAEELHQEISSTTKKKNIRSRNKRTMSSEKENIVALNLNQDRPKRIRKTPDFFTY
jgi:hypothetical protein